MGNNKDDAQLTQLENQVRRGQRTHERIVTDPDTYYYFCPARLGDNIYVLGFARAMARRHGCGKVKIVIKAGYAYFARCYFSEDEILLLSNEDMKEFELFCQVYQVYRGPNWLFAFCRFVTLMENGKEVFSLDLPGLVTTYSYFDRYRWTFGLPWNTPCEPFRTHPPAGMKEALEEKFSLSREKTVVLMPYSYSFLRTLDKDKWTLLGRVLTDAGYQVYSNVGYEDEAPLPGTLPMHTNFEELSCVSQSIRAFISARSGITDYLAAIGAPQIVLTACSRVSAMRDYLCVSEEMDVPCRTIQLALEESSMFWLCATISAILSGPIQEREAPGLDGSGKSGSAET